MFNQWIVKVTWLKIIKMYYYKYYIIYPILYGILKKFKNLQSQIEEYKRPLRRRWEKGDPKTDLDGL